MTTGAGGRAAVETSVITVLGADRTVTEAAVEGLVRTASSSVELIAVANGTTWAAELVADRWPQVRLVTFDTAVPVAAAANRGAAHAVGRLLCFIAPGAVVVDDWLPPLLRAVDGKVVGCAVTKVVAPDGTLLDAGWMVQRHGGPTALGAGTSTSSLEHCFPRRCAGGSRGCICVLRTSFVSAGGFDASLDDLAAAGLDLSETLRSEGLLTMYEPASQVVLHDEAHPGTAAAPGGAEQSLALRDADCPDRILVVARTVPCEGRSHADRRVTQLLSDLSVVVPDGRLTLLAVNGRDADRSATRFLSRGIEVAVGPEDWDAWFRRRSMLFTHVVLTDLPALRQLDVLLRSTQPQAQRVLCLPSLDFRDVAGSAPTDGAGHDAEATELVVRHLHGSVTRAAMTCEAVWCAAPTDRAWFAANLPGIPCTEIPTAAGWASPDVPFDERSGYVVLAAPGSDLTAGHEDSALLAARQILPGLLAREPSTFLRVVVDDPSPGLQLLAGRNLELVPAGGDPARWLRRSRVCLALYPRGNGSREAIMLAIDARTPFVTSQAAAADLGVGHLATLVPDGDALSAALTAENLHNQPRLWGAAHDELVRLATGSRSWSHARLKLLRACAGVGIAPSPEAAVDEPIPPAHHAEEPELRPRRVAVVGSAWKTALPAPDEPLPSRGAPVADAHWSVVPVNDQYRRWCARYGPTRRRLEQLTERLAGMVRRPTISVIMPVFNTEAAWLHEAIASVRTQVYDRWELCIADDGSSNQATLDVLEAHRAEEPRIRIVRLPGQQGIAAASNAALTLATGEFVGFLDHDDELKPHALGEMALALDDQPRLDLLYSDEDKREPDGNLVDPFFKPDWSPDHLMSRNYVCHFMVLRRTFLEKLGGFRLGYDGSQDYDLVLRASELTTQIAHVPQPLYTWRKVQGSTAADGDAKLWALDSARKALADALERRRSPGEVVDGMLATTYRVRYAIRGCPKVSILIPTRDRVDLLENCIDSIRERSTYTNYEIVVVDNQSADPATLAYLARFPGTVLRYPHRFNYSRMMNLAAHEADGDMLLFLNNDTQVVSEEWLEALVEHGQRPEVGVVGPRLLYPSGRPQHEGTIIGHYGGHAGNVDHGGYWGLGDIVRNCSAVTGACLLMRPSVYWELGGHDERLRVAWNDVDLCLRARQAGYEVVYTPYAQLFHVEGGTRGIHAHVEDDDLFEGHWVTHKCLDPYYNPNLERLYPFRIRS